MKGATWSVCCTANGCTFLRERLTKKAAALEATSHPKLCPGHNVVLVDRAAESGR